MNSYETSHNYLNAVYMCDLKDGLFNCSTDLVEHTFGLVFTILNVQVYVVV